MIARHVYVKLKDEYANQASRLQIAEESQRRLAAISGVAGVRVGLPADAASEKSWDLAIEVRFAGLDAVEPYRTDPAHRAYVDDYLRPRMEVIKAWNFALVGE